MVRIVVATIAFRMGLDTPNVRQVIHWGPPEDLEFYVQETGCGGRDGAPTRVTLFYKKADLSASSHITEPMCKYCTNLQDCRRKVLISEFTEDELQLPSYLHLCCDVCVKLCKCEECNKEEFSLQLYPSETTSPICMLPPEARKELTPS